MGNRITDELIENVSILAKLELSADDRLKAKADMEELLDFIEVLGEVNTDDIELTGNGQACAFREDVITNSDKRDELLANAPMVRAGMYVVPKTI